MLGAPFSGLGSSLGFAEGHSGHGGAPVVPPTIYSLEVGRTMWGQDYLSRNDVPSGGVLFSVWTKVPDTISSYPYTRGNMEAFNLYGSNWNMRFVCGNIVANSAVDCGYNANSMMTADGGAFGQPNGTYLGDFSYLQDTGRTVGQVTGWVFVAWQVLIGVSDVTIRQWVRYSGGAVQGPFASTMSFTQLRTWAEESGWAPGTGASWTPSAPTRFTIGTVNDICNGYYVKARMESNSALPSNSYIESLATLTSPDTSAWADWSLKWDTDLSVSVLTDQSGNARTLTLQSGGTLYQGPVFSAT